MKRFKVILDFCIEDLAPVVSKAFSSNGRQVKFKNHFYILHVIELISFME